MIKLRIALIFLSCAAILSADTTLTNTDINYSIYLPDNWVHEVISDSQHTFYDTTVTYHARLSIVRHTNDPADNLSPDEWTMAYFYAYTIGCDSGVYISPWGAVLYRDTSTQQGNLWAPELLAYWFSLDTVVGAWAEYVRYTASGPYGWELYAVSDTTDMKTNVGLYAGILQGVALPEIASGVINAPSRNVDYRICNDVDLASVKWYGPLGRQMYLRTNATHRALSAGLYVTRGRKVLTGIGN